jgi:hypothetical protein
MATSLDIGPDGHSAKECRCRVDVDPHDTNRIAAIQQELGMVARRTFLRAIVIVDTDVPTGLEQHSAPDIVIRLPLGRILGTAEDYRRLYRGETKTSH